ncbi:putative wd40 repeat protein [Operophtera brumata]|uniref:Putative wd40 repeat protein n=1 Tax=Operophtera brumata TaxID=104452 RepID=A0A0L7L3V2_OPEBR|nr:putative wd40 repeat protein [Operophtera brumata]
MIHRYARLLLSSGRLLALGKMAAALDLHLVAWLAREREAAARVDSAVLCLRKLHEDFAWPYPVLNQDADLYMQRKSSTVTSEGSVAEGGGVAWVGESGEERRYAALMERLHHHQAERGDHTAHVRLRYSSHSVAEGGGVAWVGESGEERRYAALMERLHHHQAERGDHTAHVRLSCIEWAVIIAVVLRDALAVLRTTNAARAGDVSLDAVRRLRRVLQDICAWTDAECYGYKPFMLAISNQIPFLTSVINTRERRISMVSKTRVRTSSAGSLTHDPKPQLMHMHSLESKLPAPQKAEVSKQSKQSVRKESPNVMPEPVVVVDRSPPRMQMPAKEDTSTGCVIM